ncbi:hypothetical protein NPIL_443771 [Nephila pilipes]|uniref:Uncharacterized protein n=1 Tax=Nephila pilipes TaxID=299642 RepID=A0A8X6PQB9_NEPPI|nr:hypothetical protein NPIL_443771 [Nephila pilipes]
MKHLPDFVLEKLKEELKEKPEKKQKSILELRKMLDDEQLNGIDIHEDFLTRYLRHSKYDIQRAFYQIRNTFLLRKKYSTLFDGIPDENFLTKIHLSLFFFFQKDAQKDARLYFFNTINSHYFS